MKNTTKLITLGLGLAMPFAVISCEDAKKKATEAADQAKDMATAVPKDAEGITAMFSKLTDHLKGVTDLKSATAKLPALASTATLIQKGMDALGGKEKFFTMIQEKPDLAKKFQEAGEKLNAQKDRIKSVSPEAFKLIDDKMKTIIK